MQLQVQNHLSQVLAILQSVQFSEVQADDSPGSAASTASDDHRRTIAEAKALAEHASRHEFCSEAYMNDIQQLGSLIRSYNVADALSLAETELTAFQFQTQLETEEMVANLIQKCRDCIRLLKAHGEQQQSRYKELKVKEDAVTEIQAAHAMHCELCNIFRAVQSHNHN